MKEQSIVPLNKKQRVLTRSIHELLGQFKYNKATDVVELVTMVIGDLLDQREICYRLDCIYEAVVYDTYLKPEDVTISMEGSSVSIELAIDKMGKQGILFDTQKYIDYEPIPVVSLNAYGKTNECPQAIKRGDDGLILSYTDENINVYRVLYDMFKPIVEKGTNYVFDTPSGIARLEIKGPHGVLTYSMSDNHLLSMIKEVYPAGSTKYYVNILKELRRETVEHYLDSGETVYGYLKSVIV